MTSSFNHCFAFHYRKFSRNNRTLIAAINVRFSEWSFQSQFRLYLIHWHVTWRTITLSEEYRWMNRLEFPFHLAPPRYTTYIVIRRNYGSVRLNICTFHFYSRSNFLPFYRCLFSLSVNISRWNKVIRVMIVNKRLPFHYDKIYALIIEREGGRGGMITAPTSAAGWTYAH